MAIEPEIFGKAAFFSIGSNDLTQYVTASSRDIAAVAASRRSRQSGGPPPDPAGGRGTARGRAARSASAATWAAIPRHLPAAHRCGLRTVSVAPRSSAGAKLAIAAATAAGAMSPMDDRPEPTASEAAVARYKSILQRSSTRGRRARGSGSPARSARTAASSRRSPIPPMRRRSRRGISRHLRDCHFSPREQRELPRRLCRAHPRRLPVRRASDRRAPRPTLYLPDLGDEKRNHELDRVGRRFRQSHDRPDGES